MDCSEEGRKFRESPGAFIMNAESFSMRDCLLRLTVASDSQGLIKLKSGLLVEGQSVTETGERSESEILAPHQE